MSEAKQLFPFGLYSTRQCAMLHIGLYENAAECWHVFLGCPHEDEIAHAKESGVVCLSLTCTYDPDKPL